MLNVSGQEIITLFGLKNASVDRNNECLCSCPYSANHRNGDRHPSFRINLDSGLYYCFAAGTGVITKDGEMPIEALVGKKTMVINGNHEWEQVEFVNCGRQRLWELTLKRDGHSKVIYTTAEHEWLVHGYRKKVQTRNLRPKARLESVNEVMCTATPNKAGMVHGFIYGDGTVTSRAANGNYHHHVYALTPTKAEFMKTCFENYYETDVKNAYLGASITTPFNMKEMPSLYENEDYLMGFVVGLFAADGSTTLNRFFSAKRDELVKLRAILTRLGIPNSPIRATVRKAGKSNMGCVEIKEDHTIYHVSIYEKLTPEIFFEKSFRKSDVNRRIYGRTGWHVESVEETNRWEDVYCCETSTGSFVLGDYIITGNCHGCGTKGNIYQLAQDILGMSSYEAHMKFGGEVTPAAVDEMMYGKTVTRANVTPLQRDIASWTCTDHPYWKQRGFTASTIGKWHLGYDESENRVVVPVYFKKELVGWSKRAVDDVTVPKWKHDQGLPKSEILFGMDNSVSDSVVLVEAPLSVIMLDQYGVSNAVASFGCKLSDSQARLLRSNYDSVLIFYDPDEAGQNGMRDAVEKLEDFVDVYVVPPTRDDPAAMSLEEDLEALRSAVPSWALDL